MYTEATSARTILNERKKIMTEVEKFWSDQNIQFPEVFSGEPLMIFGRPLCARIESMSAIRISEESGLGFLWLTYDEDLFVEGSPLKRSLLKPMTSSRINKNGDLISEKKSYINEMKIWNRKPLSQIVTSSGVNVLSIHKQYVQKLGKIFLTHDMSSWAKKIGNASEYYEFYLSLAVAHGALLEDYHSVGESGVGLSTFTERVFQPAFEKVTKRFGVPPVLVKLPWKHIYSIYPEGELLDNWRQRITSKL